MTGRLRYSDHGYGKLIRQGAWFLRDVRRWTRSGHRAAAQYREDPKAAMLAGDHSLDALF